MQLTAVRNLLAVAPDSLQQADRDAFSLSLLWAQSVALTNKFDLGSEGYVRAVTGELAKIAWTVTDAAGIDYANTGGKLSPGKAVNQSWSPTSMPVL